MMLFMKKWCETTSWVWRFKTLEHVLKH